MTNDCAENDYWSPTIAAFEPLHLKSPELTPKLLQRPPFRFIHDIITSINTQYNTFTHVFTQEMLVCANIDSKEKKIKFLSTLIHFVETTLKMKMEINPKKIVSGSEPEKTNLFLQSIASIVSKKTCNLQPSLLSTSSPVAVNTEGMINEPTSTRENYPTTETDKHLEINVNDKVKSIDVKKNHHDGNNDSNSSKTQKVIKVDAVRRDNILASVKVYNDKIANYALNLNATEKRSISDEGKSIVNMWNDLQQDTIDTTPSQLSQEALEMAIKRQIDTIQQISKLSSENDKLVDELEELLL